MATEYVQINFKYEKIAKPDKTATITTTVARRPATLHPPTTSDSKQVNFQGS